MSAMDVVLDGRVLGFLILALIVPLYVWWEWQQSAATRERRHEIKKAVDLARERQRRAQ